MRELHVTGVRKFRDGRRIIRLSTKLRRLRWRKVSTIRAVAGTILRLPSTSHSLDWSRVLVSQNPLACRSTGQRVINLSRVSICTHLAHLPRTGHDATSLPPTHIPMPHCHCRVFLSFSIVLLPLAACSSIPQSVYCFLSLLLLPSSLTISHLSSNSAFIRPLGLILSGAYILTSNIFHHEARQFFGGGSQRC